MNFEIREVFEKLYGRVLYGLRDRESLKCQIDAVQATDANTSLGYEGY